MPSIRVTVSLNTNQSLKTPLLIPADSPLDPSDAKSVYSFVVKAAATKLRLKKVQRVFVARNGDELVTEEDWRGALKNDVVLLMSAGEDYVGLKKEAGRYAEYGKLHSFNFSIALLLQIIIKHQPSRSPAYNSTVNLDCPIVNLARNAVVDTRAIFQLEQTAHTLPGLIHAVGQPDLHPGNRFPIGAVFVSDGWIHPPLIGGDIGCGMAWYRVTGLSRRQVDGDKGKKIADNLRGLEGKWGSQESREAWLTKGGKCYSAGEEWDTALGTIGAGNHFAELQVVESSSTDELKEDEVVLLVHSGSRGYGGDILKRHASDDDPSFQADSPKANAYMEEHERACEWARGNRDLIALRFLTCLEPGASDWELGFQRVTANLDHVQDIRAKINARKVVDIWHNNVEKISWPPTASVSLENASSALAIQEQEQTQPAFAYVHRKGAAPTYDPYTKTPLSILPLPGSRGTPTLILRPKFTGENKWGAHNALSLAHGAGRAMSRSKALSTFGAKFNKNMDTQLIPTAVSQTTQSADGRDVHGGTWVICDQKELVWEESPDAYKDVFAVADDLEREGVAEVMGWLRARVSYKVRHEQR